MRTYGTNPFNRINKTLIQKPIILKEYSTNFFEIKGYVISESTKEEANCNWKNLSEELCKELCDVVDNGSRYSESSRYNYSCNGYSHHKEIQFGTAVAAVKFACMKKFGKDIKYIRIVKSDKV